MMRRAALVMCLSIIVSCSARTSRGQLLVVSAWVRPAASGQNSAAYFTLINGGASDRLLGVESIVAERTMLHETRIGEDGIVRMQQLTQLEIPAGATIPFEPGGLHVMLAGLKTDLGASQEVNLNLLFRDAGRVEVSAIVEAR